MKTRMVPISKIFQKHHVLFVTSLKNLVKILNLSYVVKKLKLDRGIIEELNDPLVHMIRNSL